MNEYNVACEFFHKEDDGFQCPKCKTKLKNPSTFSKHIKDQHNGTSKPISKNKHKRTKDQTGSEEDSGSDEESSVTLKHQKITKPQLNVNTSILYSSSSSFTRLDHDSAVLMASSALSLPKAEQEKKLMLAKVGDWKPISVITKTGKAYSVIASQDVIKELLSDQPSGEWKLPKPPINRETQTFDSPNDLLTHIMYSSPLKHHLSTAKYVELTKDLVKNINRDWTVFPQLRFATSKLFAGAILMDQASALLINAVEPYGRLKATDAHYERRLSVSHDQSSFPTEETEYGWIKFVSVIEDNVKKLKIGTLVSNLLVTSSVRLDSDSIKSKGFVNMGPETPMFAPTTTTKI
ncbi:hypothetical protein G6F42_023754 [Rhizopus arrhizus]|nr:hypothetical protein G6F42_023754 [Rhizopus arrhizus]